MLHLTSETPKLIYTKNSVLKFNFIFINAYSTQVHPMPMYT